MAKNKFRTNVTRRDGRIVYNFHKVKHYFSYNDTLFKILRRSDVMPDIDTRNNSSPSSHRLTLRVQTSSGEYQKVYSYWLAYACYHGYVNDTNNFVNDLLRFKAQSLSDGLVIDHLNDDFLNNTKGNLSLMSSALNGNKKNDIISRVRYPAAFVAAFDADGNYRIYARLVANKNATDFIKNEIKSVTGIHDIVTTTFQLICHDAESFVNCLNELLKSDIGFTEPVSASRKERRHTAGWTDNTLNAIRLQSKLLEYPPDVFSEYTPEAFGTLHLTGIRAMASRRITSEE